MEKRVVISGSRNYNNYDEARGYIDFCISEIRKKFTLIFVSGGCRGADKLGERYAAEKGFQFQEYPADWEKYGKSAGPKRNIQMAEVGDYFICFPARDSMGTKLMIEYVTKLRKPIRIKRV